MKSSPICENKRWHTRAGERIRHILYSSYAPPGSPRLVVTFSVLILLGVCATLISYQPGYMSRDSVTQYSQAVNDEYTDAHPPLMSKVWHYWDLMTPGPFGMLLFHSMMFWIGLGLVFSFLRLPTSMRLLGFLCVGFYPPVFGTIGVVWKDVSMISSAILASGLIMAYRGTRKAWLLPPALLFLFYSLSVRHNGVALVMPLVCWLVSSLLSDKLRPARCALACVVVGCLLTTAMWAVSIRVSHRFAERTHVWQTLLMYDLVGISVLSEQSAFGDGLSKMLCRGTDIDTLKQYYTPVSHMTLTQGIRDDPNDPGRLYKYSCDNNVLEELRSDWLRAVRRHPRSYIRHRWGVFREMLGISRRDLWGAVYTPKIVPNSLGLDFNPSPMNIAMTRVQSDLSRTPFYRIWVYLLFDILFMCIATTLIRKRYASSLFFLSMSSVVYSATYFFGGCSPDFRYGFPVIIGCLMCFWFLLALLLSRCSQIRDDPGRQVHSPVHTDTTVLAPTRLGMPGITVSRCLSFGVSGLVIVAFLFTGAKFLDSLPVSRVSALTEHNVEMSPMRRARVGDMLTLDFVGISKDLLPVLKYRLMIKTESEHQKWKPVGPFSATKPSYRLTAPGRIGVGIEVLDKRTGDKASWTIGQLVVHETEEGKLTEAQHETGKQ